MTSDSSHLSRSPGTHDEHAMRTKLFSDQIIQNLLFNDSTTGNALFIAVTSVRRGEANVPWPPPQILKIKKCKNSIV